jgi:urate oxidase
MMMDEAKIEALLNFLAENKGKVHPYNHIALKELCKEVLKAVEEENDSIFEALSEMCLLTVSPYPEVAEIVYGIKTFAQILWEKNLEKKGELSDAWKKAEEGLIQRFYSALKYGYLP